MPPDQFSTQSTNRSVQFLGLEHPETRFSKSYHEARRLLTASPPRITAPFDLEAVFLPPRQSPPPLGQGMELTNVPLSELLRASAPIRVRLAVVSEQSLHNCPPPPLQLPLSFRSKGANCKSPTLLRSDATWPRIAEVNSWVSTALVAFVPNPFTESTRWSWPGQAGALTRP
jgi:hypothetical protein